MKETLKIKIQRDPHSPSMDIVAATTDYVRQIGHNDAIFDSETQIRDVGYTFKYTQLQGSLS
jgi:hypothetical protein